MPMPYIVGLGSKCYMQQGLETSVAISLQRRVFNVRERIYKDKIVKTQNLP